MTLTKSEIIGFSGTVIVHILLIVCLLNFGFNKSEKTVDEGIIVNFGNIDDAAGLFEPAGEAVSTKNEAVSVSEPTPDDTKNIISQDQEASISLNKKKETEELRKVNEAKLIKLQTQQKQAEQEQKVTAIKNQTASAFGTSTGKGTSQGSGLSGSGNQGSINGTLDSKNTNGGGTGYGHFSLNGRNLSGGLPRPSYSIQEEGTVVVQITVSPKGSVTSSSISLKGTNTDNSTLRNAALSAAKQAKFNTINGSQSQSGTITYRFRLK